MRQILRDLFDSVIAGLDLTGALDSTTPALIAEVEASKRTRVVAFGKAAVAMTDWLHGRLGPISGVVSAPDLAGVQRAGLEHFEGGHPLPNTQSLAAADAALAVANDAGESDLVLFLISGGGSALMEKPLSPTISLTDLQQLNRALVSCGADIVEMNAVRKHVSCIKGGRLALAAHPAAQLTLYVSDVRRGEESSVASGPTMPDQSTREDARRVVSRYRLESALPDSVVSLLASSQLPETPKRGDACFARSEWIEVLSNEHAVSGAVRYAQDRGWTCRVDNSVDDAGVDVAARRLVERVRAEVQRSSASPVCVVSGGELSSPVSGNGVGGRNQAFVLECASLIAGENIAVMSAGTDGIDGNSPAAGAVADGTSLQRARAAGMDGDDFKRRSDAYHFFARLGDDITCGPTGNNVRDIRVLVGWPES